MAFDDQEYHGALECKYETLVFPIIMDVVIMLKAIFLIVVSIQGLRWWRKTKSTHIFISIQLWIGILIILGVAVARFTERPLILQFILQFTARYLFLWCICSVIGFTAREHGKSAREAQCKMYGIFVPIHIAFIAVLVLAFFKDHGAYCHDTLGYPFIFVLLEFVSALTILAVWMMHC